MEKGWFDNFSTQSFDRNIDSNGIVSYSITTSNIRKIGNNEYLMKSSKDIDLLEMFVMTLKQSKKTLSPELKQVIDDIPLAEINNLWGLSEYTTKTPLGHAIDDINVETVDYLIKKGANTNISGTNQKHILQELLVSNATDKRIQILELVLPTLNLGTIPVTKGFDGSYFSIKYLIPLINSNQISDSDVEMIYTESKPKQKKLMALNCERVAELRFGEKFGIEAVKSTKALFSLEHE